MIGAGLRMLVVGAGIAGLGVVRALRQRGLAADSSSRPEGDDLIGRLAELP